MFRHVTDSLDSIGGFLLFLFLPLTFVLPHTMEKYFPLPVSKALARMGGYWFIFAFYATLLLLPFSLLWMVFLILGEAVLWQQLASCYAQATVIFLAMLLPVGAYRAIHPTRREITIRTPKIKEKHLTIAFASDIHLGMVLSHSFCDKLVQDMNELQADVILFGGDIIDGNLDFVLKDGSFENFHRLKARIGVYAVLGNHDYYGQDILLEKAELERQGIRCLMGETIHLSNGVQITGMEDALFYPQRNIPVADAECFSILVDHEPVRIEQAALAGYELYLTGHTHAGQFWPIRHFTKKMFWIDYGCRKFQQLTTVVSSGYGAWGALFRLGAKPEIVVVHLIRQHIS